MSVFPDSLASVQAELIGELTYRDRRTFTRKFTPEASLESPIHLSVFSPNRKKKCGLHKNVSPPPVPLGLQFKEGV